MIPTRSSGHFRHESRRLIWRARPLLTLQCRMIEAASLHSSAHAGFLAIPFAFYAPNTPPIPPHIAIIGLGYVGLPLAVAFGQHHATVGFDVSAARIAQLQQGHDASAEVDAQELAAASRLRFSADEADLAACNVFIVAVPTPVDAARRP